MNTLSNKIFKVQMFAVFVKQKAVVKMQSFSLKIQKVLHTVLHVCSFGVWT